jgi:hypothetical protein
MEQVFLGLGLVHFQCFISLYVSCCFLQKMFLLRLTSVADLCTIWCCWEVLLLFSHALLLATVDLMVVVVVASEACELPKFPVEGTDLCKTWSV